MRIFYIIVITSLIFAAAFHAAKAGIADCYEIASIKNKSELFSCQQKQKSFAENVHAQQSLVSNFQKRDQNWHGGTLIYAVTADYLLAFFHFRANNKQSPRQTRLCLLLLFPQHYFW